MRGEGAWDLLFCFDCICNLTLSSLMTQVKRLKNISSKGACAKSKTNAYDCSCLISNAREINLLHCNTLWRTKNFFFALKFVGNNQMWLYLIEFHPNLGTDALHELIPSVGRVLSLKNFGMAWEIQFHIWD